MALISPRLIAQIVKELLCLLRDPKSRFVLIGPPLIQLCVFSFAATLEVKNVDIAVYNRDAGMWSRELIARVAGAGFVKHLHPVHEPEQIRRMVEQRTVIAAIDIPESFSRDIASGRTASAQVLLDGRRGNASQVLLGYLNNVIHDLDANTIELRRTKPSPEGEDWVTTARIAEDRATQEQLPRGKQNKENSLFYPPHPGLLPEGEGAHSLKSTALDLDARFTETGPSAAETIAVRHWFNPNLIYRWFVVPSIGGILVTFVTLLVTSLSIARERELGTFDQLLVSPCTPWEIIVAKCVPAVLVGSILGTFMVAAGVIGFGVPFTGSFILWFVSLIIFILSVVGIGLMISSICATQQQAILGTFAVGVPAVLMSGFATPVENMPTVLQYIAQAIPLKHYLIILQGSFLKALSPAEVLANVWPMALIALVSLTVATFFVRGHLQ